MNRATAVKATEATLTKIKIAKVTWSFTLLRSFAFLR
jgi:hypothetical protein